MYVEELQFVLCMANLTKKRYDLYEQVVFVVRSRSNMLSMAYEQIPQSKEGKVHGKRNTELLQSPE